LCARHRSEKGKAQCQNTFRLKAACLAPADETFFAKSVYQLTNIIIMR
jgi:hypothetical protein